MRPMSEREFLTLLGARPSIDTLGEVLPDFLRSHGFEDAASAIARSLANIDDSDGFLFEIDDNDPDPGADIQLNSVSITGGGA